MKEEGVIQNANTDHRDVKSSEFFYENMDVLGFTSPSKALVMAVKEAIDNSLDSCEDIGILPEIYLRLEDVGDGVIKMCIEDNAGGVPRDVVKEVFGEILYSSRFGVWKQTRGQQGIGISAVILWSQKYLSENTIIRSKQPEDDCVYEVELSVEKKGKEPKIVNERSIHWDKEHGTQIEVPLKANWRSSHKLDEYLEGTSLANPHAQITYDRKGDVTVFERKVETPPDPPEELPPHPDAVDIGMLEELISQSEKNNIWGFLLDTFPKLGRKNARRVLQRCDIEKENPFLFEDNDLENIARELRNVRTRSPDGDGLRPLGKDLVRTTLETYNPEFVGTSIRDTISVKGHPLIIESGIAYGGDIDKNGNVKYHRVANKVPLVYDAGACATKKAIRRVNWERYNLQESSTGDPMGPAIIFLHVCSTSVPFGSEAKTHIANREEIINEAKLSLQECAREFSRYIQRQRRQNQHKEKVETMIPIYSALGEKIPEITNKESDILESVGSSCDTVIVNEKGKEIYNPTNSSQTITVDGEKYTLSEGERIEYKDTFDFTKYPVKQGEF